MSDNKSNQSGSFTFVFVKYKQMPKMMSGWCQNKDSFSTKSVLFPI